MFEQKSPYSNVQLGEKCKAAFKIWELYGILVLTDEGGDSSNDLLI